MVGVGDLSRDPLEAWVRYTKWLLENYTAGSERIVYAVEEVCRLYAKNERYRDDVRLLRLWIRYIELRNDRIDVFNYMIRRSIGQSWTLFYEAWAITLEVAHKFDDAARAYQLGKEKNAKPIERLLQREREYYKRMAARRRRDEKKKRDSQNKKLLAAQRDGERKQRESSRTGRPSSLANSLLAPNPPPTHQQSASKLTRPALGRITEDEARSGYRPLVRETKHTPAPGVSSARAPLPPSSSAGFEVYKDPSTSASRPPTIPTASSKPLAFEVYVDPSTPLKPPGTRERDTDSNDAFPALPKRDELRKEDAGPQPSTWAGQTLPQGKEWKESQEERVHTANASAVFTVYEDPEVVEKSLPLANELPGTSTLHEDEPPLKVARSEYQKPISPRPAQNARASVGMASPTINTKLAMQEVDDMFNTTLRMGDDIPGPKSILPELKPVAHVSSEKENAIAEPTDNTKMAMEEVDDMFNSTLPIENNISSQQPVLSNNISSQQRVLSEAPSIDLLTNLANGKENLLGVRPDEGHRGALTNNPQLESRVLQNIPEMEGPYIRRVIDDDDLPQANNGDNSIVYATPQPENMAIEGNASEGEELGDFMAEWCMENDDFMLLDDDDPVIIPGNMFDMECGRGLLALNVDRRQWSGHTDQSTIVLAEDMNNTFRLMGSSKPVESDDDDLPVIALKVADYSNVWEFYIYKIIHERSSGQIKNIPQALGFCEGRQKSYLFLDTACSYNLVGAKQMYANNVFPEPIAMFFTVRILLVLEQLHAAGVIHSDVTLDNILVRFDPNSQLAPGGFRSTGDEGWSDFGILLVDFNNSVDGQHPVTGGDAQSLAAYCAKSGNDFLHQDYRQPGADSWAYNSDCYAAAVCAGKLLGIDIGDPSRPETNFEHPAVWRNFFERMASLSSLSASSDTVKAMAESRKEMQVFLEKRNTLSAEMSELRGMLIEADFGHGDLANAF